MASNMYDISQSELKTRTIIQKIRDSEAGGMQSVKSEEYFHGYIPTKQTPKLLKKHGDFLVRQAVKAETKNSTREQFVVSIRLTDSRYVLKEHENWYQEWLKRGRNANAIEGRILEEVDYEQLDEKMKDNYILVEEGIGHFPMKYSRRARLYYMHKYGFTHSSGLIDYHIRHKISVSPTNRDAILRRSIQKDKWQYNHEQIERVRRLGEGAFGEVFEGTLRLGLIKTVRVAVKTVTGTVTAEENEKLFEEAMLMQRLEHPNIVKLFGVASNEDPVMIVMELCTGGSVLDAVRKIPTPPISRKIEYVRGAALGLQYLQNKGIVHRDLAARNTLIGGHHAAKISDFGLSITGGQKKEKKLHKMPTRYLAPQTLRNAVFDFSTDMYSFGMMIYEVFHNGPEELYKDMAVTDIRKFVLSGNRLGINEGFEYPQIMWELTQGCWMQAAANRLTIGELIRKIEEHDELLHGGHFQKKFVRQWKKVQMAQPCPQGWNTGDDDVALADAEDKAWKAALKRQNLEEKKKISELAKTNVT